MQNRLMQGFFDLFKPEYPGEKREAFCAHLVSIGINARLAQRGSPEELFREPKENSLGLIYIYNQVLDWANMVQGPLRSTRERDLLYYRSAARPYYYRIWYGVKDANLSISTPMLRFRSVRQRSPKVFGPVVDVTWGNELQQMELEPLCSDDALKQRLIKERVDVDVAGFPDGYWLIANREAGRPPTQPIWECYEAVAAALLQSSKHIGLNLGPSEEGRW